MRYQQRIQEAGTGLSQDEISTLHKDCKWFLTHKSVGQKLFRGSKRIYNNLTPIKPRKNRQPKDLPIEVHTVLDDAFKKKFGWRPRTEGVFATTRISQAEGFGTAHYMFPIGKNYKIIYHPRISDIYNYFQNNDIINSQWKLHKDATEERIKIFVDDAVKDYKQTTDISRAMYSNNELMIQVKSYYMMNVDRVQPVYHEVFDIEGSSGGYTRHR